MPLLAALSRRRLTGLFSLGAALLVACSQGGVADLPDEGPGDGQDGPALVFRPATTLTIAPREKRELTVVVTPPGTYSVRFALLSGSTGEGPLDAALDRTETDTDREGIAHAELTAPSAPVTFSLRASIDDGPQTSVAVSVSASGFVALEVVPSYSGKRVTEHWVATVRAGLSCDDPALAGTPTPDGDLWTEGDAASDLVVEGVPVGPVLAVTARVGHYIGGCTTLSEVREGGLNRVIVPMTDRPIQLGATKLAVGFGIQNSSPAWDAALEADRESIVSALRAGAADDVTAVLDQLDDVVPAAQKEVVAGARPSRGWDAAIALAYPDDEANLLSNHARQWMLEGLAILAAPDAVKGQLVAEEDDPARAILTLFQVGAQLPAAVGMPSTAPAAWSADSHDVLLVGTNLLWSPKRLLAGLALEPALSAVPSAESVARALANRLDCALFVATLLSSGEPQGELYPSCTQSCAIEHCRAAVAALWEAASSEEQTTPPLLALSASGDATVGDGAEALALYGSWVGRYSAENEDATASGPFSGTPLEE
jgi:hypothetical protein